MNSKLLVAFSYLIIFVASSIFFSKFSVARIQDMGSLLGLGGVVVGYFANKKINR